MMVTFEEKNSKDLTGSVEFNEVMVEPNSVRDVKYSLRTRQDTWDEAFELKVKVKYLTEDSLMSMEIPYSYRLKPIEKRILKKSSNPVKIDGNESEWSEFPYSFNQSGAFDASFQVQYDDQFLYAAMKVIDDKVYSTGKGAPWIQDNAGFGFSPDPLHKSVMKTGRGYYRQEIYQLITPENGEVSSVLYREMPEGMQIKCVQKDYGYFMEIAVPISLIEERQGKDWKSIRVVAIVDDKDGSDLTRHWWLANWMDPASNYIGSGLFFRQ